MEQVVLKPQIERVTARTVASFLGIKETTVYSLCRGMRGWGTIEKLPHTYDRVHSRRARYTFDLNAVEAWRDRTGFVVKPSGRGKRRIPVNGTVGPATASAG